MKKLLVLLLCITLIFCLTACQADDEAVAAMFNALKQRNMIDDDFQLIDEMLKVDAGILPSKNKYYIYENSASEIIAINYKTYSEGKYDYLVEIYYSVSVNDDIEYHYGDTGHLSLYYKYSDGNKSTISKYDLNDKKVYEVQKYKGLFFNDKYRFDLK